MRDIQSLSHTTWNCKYHLVLIPRCRKKVLYGELRKYLGVVFRDLAMQKESKILEGHMLGDHIHMLISIPPKYAVSQVVRFIINPPALPEVTECQNRPDISARSGEQPACPLQLWH